MAAEDRGPATRRILFITRSPALGVIILTLSVLSPGVSVLTFRAGGYANYP